MPFPKGTSGNPEGRKKGSVNKINPFKRLNILDYVQQEVVEPSLVAFKEAWFNTMEMARNGDLQAMKIVCSKLPEFYPQKSDKPGMDEELGEIIELIPEQKLLEIRAGFIQAANESRAKPKANE